METEEAYVKKQYAKYDKSTKYIDAIKSLQSRGLYSVAKVNSIHKSMKYITAFCFFVLLMFLLSSLPKLKGSEFIKLINITAFTIIFIVTAYIMKVLV
jgi:hypothetical protein